MNAERDAEKVATHEVHPEPNDIPVDLGEPVPSSTVCRSHVPPLGFPGPLWANAEAMASVVEAMTSVATSAAFREDIEWRLP